MNLSSLGERLAKPFRDADRINKQVIVKYSKQYFNGVTVLEVGAGGDPLIEHINAKEKIVLDLEHILSYCRTRGYTCIAQDAGKPWQLKDNSVDLVVSNQCLEHIPNTDHFIREAYRALRKSGYFIVSVPNQGSLISIWSLIFTISPPMNFVSDDFIMLGNPLSKKRFAKRDSDLLGYGHLRLFTVRGMRDLLKAHNFTIIKSHGGSWGLPFIGKGLAKIFPHYGIYVTVIAKKE